MALIIYNLVNTWPPGHIAERPSFGLNHLGNTTGSGGFFPPAHQGAPDDRLPSLLAVQLFRHILRLLSHPPRNDKTLPLVGVLFIHCMLSVMNKQCFFETLLVPLQHLIVYGICLFYVLLSGGTGLFLLVSTVSAIQASD